MGCSTDLFVYSIYDEGTSKEVYFSLSALSALVSGNAFCLLRAGMASKEFCSGPYLFTGVSLFGFLWYRNSR